MSTTFEQSTNNEEAFKNNLKDVIAKLQQIDGYDDAYGAVVCFVDVFLSRAFFRRLRARSQGRPRGARRGAVDLLDAPSSPPRAPRASRLPLRRTKNRLPEPTKKRSDASRRSPA